MIFFSYGQNTIGEELWKLKILCAALPLGNRGNSQVCVGCLFLRSPSRVPYSRFWPFAPSVPAEIAAFRNYIPETHFRDEPATVHIVASNFANELRANSGFDKFVFMRV
jgi:hypothetical protein